MPNLRSMPMHNLANWCRSYRSYGIALGVTFAGGFVDQDPADRGWRLEYQCLPSIRNGRCFIDYAAAEPGDQRPCSELVERVRSATIRGKTFTSTDSPFRRGDFIDSSGVSTHKG